MENMELYTREFETFGYTVLHSVIPNASDWAAKVLTSPSLRRVFVPEAKRTVKAGGGDLKYWAMDRYATDLALDEIGDFYTGLVKPLKTLTGQDVIVSPYERTAYYCKVYKESGDEQGWHFDTNGLTVIVYLTDNLDSGRTEIVRMSDGKHVHVVPKAGSLLVMQGRICWHRAEPIIDGVKVICPLNYYIGLAEKRDDRLDDIIFGNLMDK